MSRRQKQLVARMREAQAYELMAQGKTTREIGAELGVTHPTVSRMLARLERSVRTRLLDAIETEKVASVVRLRWAYAEACAAWQRSKEPTAEKVSRKTERGQMAQVRTRDQVGDPRYLAEARGALQQLAQLLGLNAPERSMVSANPRPNEHLTDEELDELITEIVLKRKRDAGGGKEPH